MDPTASTPSFKTSTGEMGPKTSSFESQLALYPQDLQQRNSSQWDYMDPPWLIPQGPAQRQQAEMPPVSL